MTSFRPLFFTRWHSAVGLGAAASIFTASGWALPASAKSANADESRDVKHKIVIIGGGAAGLGTASMLLRKGGGKTADVAIIEPADHHYYQPYWTLVGGGKGKLEDSRRSMASVMPKEATWIKQGATAVDPDAQAVVLADGRRVHYEYLVVAAGIKVDMSSVKGLEATLGKNGVSTIYDYNYAGKAWDDIMAFKKGTALFTMPKTGVKCGGAPQKIMWLAEDYWRHEAKVRPDVEVEFVTGTGSMFGVPKYSNALEKIRDKRGVLSTFKHDLVEVDGERKIATFETGEGARVQRPFDLLHVVPKMGPYPWLAQSKIADPQTGYVSVDKETLQHTRFPNVFALGDCSNLPTSKTAAAITAQTPILVHNLRRVMAGKPANAKYDGYTCCPIVTGRGKLILAEFKYGGETKETMPWLFDQAKEHAPFYFMKTIVFPWAYWNLMLRGRWFGTNTVFEPSFPDPV
mmetsp:Transcript_5725/g.17042  ORF Transcript_5725/g.17042 Transcript_5725/m.17042 type:complete len:460 (-) Transcript_5725:282-1661(-)